MWRAVKENIRLSGKVILLAALAPALVTTLLSGLTITANLRFGAHLTLGLLHFVFAYLFIATLWMPLTWLRKKFFHSQHAWSWAALLSLPITLALCLIVPYNLIIGFFSALEEWLVEAAIIGFHLSCVFIFILSLGKVERPYVVWLRKGTSWPAANRPRAEEKIEAGEVPFRPRLLLGAVSFIIGLYFVLIFESWMVNLNLTVSRDESIRSRLVCETIKNLIALDSANFKSLPKFFQPYQSIQPLQELKKPRQHRDQFQPRIGQHDIELVEQYVSERSLMRPAVLSQWPEMPPDSLSEAASRRMKTVFGSLLPVISMTLAGAFLLFFGGIVPLRLMGFVLPAVWYNENEYRKRLLNTVIYTKQFYLALLVQNPLFSIAGLLVWFLVTVPLLVFIGGQLELLTAMIGPDQILFTFAALAAWLNPVVYAGVYVDRTFGLYFNTRLANLILGVRGHVVVFGFGDLGHRVIDREMLKLDRRRIRRKVARFEQIVSPELDVEELCSHFIIVDRDTNNFLFAATSDALGNYGVVAAMKKPLSAPEPPRKRRRVLVPIVQGDATEPFTLSRVNLQRASFLISTISQEERIHEVFDRAAETGLRSIICVSRSDQIVNLTYKASRHPITFVYPKQDSGMALGQRLISAVLKVEPNLPPEQIAPRIMVVGLNKSNYFMLQTLWYYWPVADLVRRAEIFSTMLRFVITGEAHAHTTPHPSSLKAANEEAAVAMKPHTDQPQFPAYQRTATEGFASRSYFTHLWHTSFVLGFRHYQAPQTMRPLSLPV
ncbi:MAG: hypothetical protein ONA90_08230, partial [candidate division KSB1 bacterium]|nr:hypothetical protein [candidate division KSB1 bacterium]